MDVEVRPASRDTGYQCGLSRSRRPTVGSNKGRVIARGQGQVQDVVIYTSVNAEWKSRKSWSRGRDAGRACKWYRRGAVNMRGGSVSRKVVKHCMDSQCVSKIIVNNQPESGPW